MSRGRRTTGLLLTAALVMTGCTSEGEEATAASAPGNADLRVAVWTSSEEHLGVMEEMADAFREQNPDVGSVTFETIPFQDYNQLLSVRLAGDNPPDVGWLISDAAAQFIDAGALVDLSDSFAGGDYDLADIPDGTLSAWRTGEGIYGYPFSNSPEVIFYNVDAIEAAGLDDPKELMDRGEWTWEQLGTMAETVAAGGDMDGFVIRDFDFGVWTKLAGLWMAHGAEPWTSDGECGLDDPEMVEAVTWFHDLVFQRGGHPAPGESADFFAGEAAITQTQISRASLLEEVGFAWDVVPLPDGPAGSHPVFGQAGFVAFSAGDHTELAAEFLAFVTGPEQAGALTPFFPPPRESLLDADALAAANPQVDAEQMARTVVAGVEGGQAPPSHPRFTRIDETVRTALDAAWLADADVEAVLGSACEAIAPTLESA